MIDFLGGSEAEGAYSPHPRPDPDVGTHGDGLRQYPLKGTYPFTQSRGSWIRYLKTWSGSDQNQKIEKIFIFSLHFI